MVPPGGTYPLWYNEVETMLVDNTIDALRMAIVGHFLANRMRQIWKIYEQTLDFPNGAAPDCTHLAIINRLVYENCLARLPLQ